MEASADHDFFFFLTDNALANLRENLHDLNINQRKMKRNEILSGLAVLAATFLIKKGMDKSYEKIAEKKPPKNPSQTDQSTKSVIGYTVLTSIITGVSAVLIRELINQND